jgi:hypothetical protein
VLSSKETLLQTERQEHEAMKKLFKESKELNEELEDKIKDATKKWERQQEDMKRFIYVGFNDLLQLSFLVMNY